MKIDSCQLGLIFIAWLVSSSVGWPTDFFDFKSSGPSPAKLSLIGDEVVLGAGTGMTTCSRKNGPTRIWFETVDRQTQVLIVDDSMETPRITIRKSDQKLEQLADHKNIPETVQWSWQYDGTSKGDGAGMRLRVETGKYKGWYLAAVPKYEKVVVGKPERTVTILRVKLVEDPKDAIPFGVYILSK